MQHIIAVLMENQPGALSRVVGLFSQRGYNIQSLNVAPTSDPTLSRLTLTTEGSDAITQQICRHLNRLIDVAQVVDLSEQGSINCELLLIKLKLKTKERTAMKERLGALRATLTDVAPDTAVIRYAGTTEEVNALIAELDQKSIIEMVRSGAVALGKSAAALKL